jgi:hypothetical protein
LQRVLQRYGRLLDMGPRELHAALQGLTPGEAAEGGGAGDTPSAAQA